MGRNGQIAAAVALLLAGVPTRASAQLSYSIDNGDGPLILCQTFDPDSLTRFSTGEVANNPKAAKRFHYHWDKYKAETGTKLSASCDTFIGLADSYRPERVPGPGFTNRNGQHVAVVPFSWLPSDWSTRPVPGEDDDGTKKKDANATEPRGIAIAFKVPATSAADQKGFVHAKADLQYAFIACAGELHIAYSVLPKSVRLGSKRYQLNGERFDVDVTPPTLAAISLHVKVSEGLKDYVEFDDPYAADALGFGCFSSQSHEVGKVKALFGTATPTRTQIEQWADNVSVDAWANTSLASADAESQILEQVRTKRLEASKKAEEGATDAPEEKVTAEVDQPAPPEKKSGADARYEDDMREYRRLEAERQQQIAAIEADKTRVAAEQAAQVARAKAVQDEYARQLAAHQVEIDAAAKARADFEAQLKAMGLTPPQ